MLGIGQSFFQVAAEDTVGCRRVMVDWMLLSVYFLWFFGVLVAIYLHGFIEYRF